MLLKLTRKIGGIFQSVSWILYFLDVRYENDKLTCLKIISLSATTDGIRLTFVDSGRYSASTEAEYAISF